MQAIKGNWSVSPQDVFVLLDLEQPGLGSVKRAVATKDFALAAHELLAYYRARTRVKYPIDPHPLATERDLQIARDALQHHFISQSSYPPQDYGKDIDWLAMVYPDVEWIVQLHRMYWWEPMGKAYRHTGDETFAREWVFQVLDWKKHCPPGDYTPGSAVWYVWRTLDIGIRAYSLCNWYHYFRDSEAFSPEFLLEFLVLLYDHARLLEPRYRAGSNWGLMESEGLAHIAMTFPEFKPAATWRETAFQRLNTELDTQVLADGTRSLKILSLAVIAPGFHVAFLSH